MRAKLRNSGESGEGTDNSTGPRDNSPGLRGNIDQDGVPTVNERERTSDDACGGPDTDDDLLRDTPPMIGNPLAEFVQKTS